MIKINTKLPFNDAVKREALQSLPAAVSPVRMGRMSPARMASGNIAFAALGRSGLAAGAVASLIYQANESGGRIRMGKVDTYVTNPTPDFLPDRDAEADLVFAMHRNRRGGCNFDW